MATILRGISERYNPQIHTEATSLTQNMEKNPAVKSKAIDLWAGKNKFISWLYATGRTNMGANAKKVMRASQGISDNAYRIKYRGSLFIPAYAFGKCQIGSYYTADTDMSGLVGAVSYTSGITSGTVDINVQGSLAVKHDPANNIFGDKYNPGDAIVLGAYEGTTFIVSQPPVKASTGDHYIVHFKVGAKKELFQEAHLAADELLSEAGNRFGEGSANSFWF